MLILQKYPQEEYESTPPNQTSCDAGSDNRSALDRCGGTRCAFLRSRCREMAQRLLLRRFLTSIISGKPSQSRWAPVASRALQTPQYSPGYLTVAPSQARSIYTTRVCSTTFNIQDGPDFQDRVVNSETPVVVDFHAQWCGPCKILGPRLEKVVAKQHGKVVMAKVDIDDHTDLALEYEVSAVPTVLAMKNGDVVDKFVGIKDEDQLEAFLKKLIG
ncbi:hypothetical protein CapIbe_004721 [Capra ibex]